MNSLDIRIGHVVERLRELRSNSVHCVVTSPPYWGLRAYGTEPQVWGGKRKCVHEFSPAGIRNKGGMQGKTGQRSTRDTSAQDSAQKTACGEFCSKCGAWRGELGLEPSIALYLQHMVLVFREVRRVLRVDGTCWLNIGDSYASNGGHTDTKCNDRRGQYNIGRRPEHSMRSFRQGKDCDPKRGERAAGQPIRATSGLKPKNLCLIPFRLALALQTAGWWVRSDIIWNKPNPMPESCTDRPTKAHEYVFLLTKSESYFYDHEAIKEQSVSDHDSGNKQRKPGCEVIAGASHVGRSIPWTNGKHSIADPQSPGRRMVESVAKCRARGANHENPFGAARNKRSVWTINPEPFPEAHFATFPQKLVEPCILAGTSARGCCPHCGAPWERVVEKEGQQPCPERNNGGRADGLGLPAKWHDRNNPTIIKTVDWIPTCKCADNKPIPCTVLDPFGGSGTTGKVAIEHGRRAILIELKPDYVDLIRRRCHVTPGLQLA